MNTAVSCFESDVLALRTLLAKTKNDYPEITEVSAETARELSKEYNTFFDALYKKFADLGGDSVSSNSKLTVEDVRTYKPALKMAYRMYLSGWIPKLDSYVNPVE